MSLVWAVGCRNNDRTVMSKTRAWRPLALLLIRKGSACTETDKDWLRALCTGVLRCTIDPWIKIIHHTQCHLASQYHKIRVMITPSQRIMIYTSFHSFIHPCWRTNCDSAEPPPVITPEANSFFILENSIMIGWCNYFMSALLTGQRCVVGGSLHHGCFVVTPNIISDIGIPISGYPILYPILYPISELLYPNIGTSDIVPDIVSDIGGTIPRYRDPRYCTRYCTWYRRWNVRYRILIPDIGAPWYREQYQSTCAPMSGSNRYRGAWYRVS